MKKINLVNLIGFVLLFILIYSIYFSSATIQIKSTLCILCIAIYLWVTELVAFPVSGLIIISLITLLLGLIPNENGYPLGTQKALALGLRGLSSPSMAMIMGSLIVASSIQHTKLDNFIAIKIMSRMKNSPSFILLGCLLVGICFAFLIPSPTGRTAVLIPILLGITKYLDTNPQKKFTMLVILGAIHISSIWNIGLLTATTHNVAGLELITSHYENFKVNWLQWFVIATPASLLLSIILFFILKQELGDYKISLNIKKNQDKIPLTKIQAKLLSYLLALIFLWITEGSLHSLSVSSSMILIASIILSPKIGVFDCWKEAEKLLPWGVLIMFGASISLGLTLVDSGASAWLAEKCFNFVDISKLAVTTIVITGVLFTIILHLGFASAASLTFSIMPVYLSLADKLTEYTNINAPAFALIQLFAISIGFILPANAPQNMLGYATGIIDIKTFIRIGIKLTIATILVFIILAKTWWSNILTM
jgi:anion transporter